MPVKLDCSWLVDETDNPAAVDRSGQTASSGVRNRIRVWCKGLRVDATIRVIQYVAEAGTTWELGFVQIVRESKMKAHYGEGIQEWEQQTLPCYDSTNDGIIPWYTVGTHRPISALDQGQTMNFTLRDYPTSHLDPYYHRPGFPRHGVALSHYMKRNKFDLYLILRKTAAGHNTDTILRHLRWTTAVEVEASDDWVSNMYNVNGYWVRKHERSISMVHAPIVHRFDELPPVINGSANDHIDETKRDAHHRRWWRHH